MRRRGVPSLPDVELLGDNLHGSAAVLSQPRGRPPRGLPGPGAWRPTRDEGDGRTQDTEHDHALPSPIQEELRGVEALAQTLPGEHARRCGIHSYSDFRERSHSPFRLRAGTAVQAIRFHGSGETLLIGSRQMLRPPSIGMRSRPWSKGYRQGAAESSTLAMQVSGPTAPGRGPRVRVAIGPSRCRSSSMSLPGGPALTPR